MTLSQMTASGTHKLDEWCSKWVAWALKEGQVFLHFWKSIPTILFFARLVRTRMKMRLRNAKYPLINQ